VDLRHRLTAGPGFCFRSPLVDCNDNLLVRTSGLSGDEAATWWAYEYTPGFNKMDGVAVGGQAPLLVNDYVRLGFKARFPNEGDSIATSAQPDRTMAERAQSG